MSTSPDLVERVRFDITVGSRAMGEAVQERLSAFQRYRLAPIIEAGIAGAGLPDAPVSLARVELDLGDVVLNQLEEVIEARLRSELPSLLRWASRSTPAVMPHAERRAMSPAASRLLAFVSGGKSDWRVQGSSGDVDALFTSALEGDANTRRWFARMLIASPAGRRRLSRQLSPVSLRRLVGAATEDESSAIRSSLLLVDGGARSVLSVPLSEAEWEAALARVHAWSVGDGDHPASGDAQRLHASSPLALDERNDIPRGESSADSGDLKQTQRSPRDTTPASLKWRFGAPSPRKIADIWATGVLPARLIASQSSAKWLAMLLAPDASTMAVSADELDAAHAPVRPVPLSADATRRLAGTLLRYLPRRKLAELIRRRLSNGAAIAQTYLRMASRGGNVASARNRADVLAREPVSSRESEAVWHAVVSFALEMQSPAFTMDAFVVRVSAQTAATLGYDPARYRSQLLDEFRRRKGRPLVSSLIDALERAMGSRDAEIVSAVPVKRSPSQSASVQPHPRGDIDTAVAPATTTASDAAASVTLARLSDVAARPSAGATSVAASSELSARSLADDASGTLAAGAASARDSAPALLVSNATPSASSPTRPTASASRASPLTAQAQPVSAPDTSAAPVSSPGASASASSALAAAPVAPTPSASEPDIRAVAGSSPLPLAIRTPSAPSAAHAPATPASRSTDASAHAFHPLHEPHAARASVPHASERDAAEQHAAEGDTSATRAAALHARAPQATAPRPLATAGSDGAEAESANAIHETVGSDRVVRGETVSAARTHAPAELAPPATTEPASAPAAHATGAAAVPTVADCASQVGPLSVAIHASSSDSVARSTSAKAETSTADSRDATLRTATLDETTTHAAPPEAGESATSATPPTRVVTHDHGVAHKHASANDAVVADEAADPEGSFASPAQQSAMPAPSNTALRAPGSTALPSAAATGSTPESFAHASSASLATSTSSTSSTSSAAAPHAATPHASATRAVAATPMSSAPMPPASTPSASTTALSGSPPSISAASASPPPASPEARSPARTPAAPATPAATLRVPAPTTSTSAASTSSVSTERATAGSANPPLASTSPISVARATAASTAPVLASAAHANAPDAPAPHAPARNTPETKDTQDTLNTQDAPNAQNAQNAQNAPLGPDLQHMLPARGTAGPATAPSSSPHDASSLPPEEAPDAHTSSPDAPVPLARYVPDALIAPWRQPRATAAPDPFVALRHWVQYGSPPHAARRARLDRLEARALRAARHRPLEWRELAHAIMADAVLRTRLHARFSAAFTRQIAAASELTSNEAEITGDESIHAARSLFAGGELPPARLRTSLVRGSTAEWLAPVLSRHVDAFVAALRSSRDDDVSARLVRYLPPAERASLLSAMLPRHVGLALTLVRAMRAIRGAAALNAPFAAERAGARTDAIWGAVFDVALRTPPDTVRADDLIAMTIDRVASDLSLTSPGFRQALLAVCQRRARRHARFAVLAELLAEPMDSPRELATGATGVRIPETETTSAASAVGNTVVALAARVARQRHAAGPINTLRHLLRFGERHTPSLSVNARLTMDDLERARRTCPAEWRELARDIAADALMRARLHARLPLRIADALTADLPAAESFSANDATSNVIVARAATRLAEGVPSRTLGADAIARPTTVSSQAEADADTPSVADIVALLSAGLLPAGANEEALIAGSTHAWIAPLLDAVHVAALQRACQTTGAANPTAVVASLVRYLPVKSLNALIAAVLPDQAGFVDTYLRAAELSDARWTDSAPFDALAEAWRSALLHVLATPREAFTSRSFVASVTAQTAHALGVDVSAYREALHAETERHSTRAPRFAPLAEILATMTATGGSTPTRAARHSRDERDVAAALWPPRRRTTRAERQDPLVAFRQVLQYGASVTTRTYDPVLFEAQLARARRTRPAEWRALARATANDPLMRARLVTRFSPRLVRRVLESLLTTGATNARRLAMRIAALLAMEADVSRATHEHMSQREMTRLWRRLARESLLAVAGRQEDPARLDSVALAREILRRAAAVKNIPLPVLLAKLRARVWASRLFGAAADAELLEIFSALERETRSRAHNAPAWTYATSSVANDDAPDDPVHVDDAGLVLLWPLFAHYFEMIGLATGGRFRSDDAAERAVLLLRFLATGSADAPEPALALDKLLCGVADEVPVPRRIDVTELESASAMELLHVVTQRWLPLRNTSVAGLRESFLLREGRLVQREDGWLLTVATAPFDMLLDSLPWSLTPVRLPWMTGLLHVKWRR